MGAHMKAKLVIVTGCLSLFLSSYANAGCGGYTSCYGGGGPCNANEYENICQCTDPRCYQNWDNKCLSKSECCEAFGNVGAR